MDKKHADVYGTFLDSEGRFLLLCARLVYIL